MEARIIQFRRGRKTITDRHYLIEIKGISDKKRAERKKEAEKFVGKEVVWTSPAGKKIKGKISATHGINGVVRAIFEKGLPGQAVTTQVEIEK